MIATRSRGREGNAHPCMTSGRVAVASRARRTCKRVLHDKGRPTLEGVQRDRSPVNLLHHLLAAEQGLKRRSLRPRRPLPCQSTKAGPRRPFAAAASGSTTWPATGSAMTLVMPLPGRMRFDSQFAYQLKLPAHHEPQHATGHPSRPGRQWPQRGERQPDAGPRRRSRDSL